MSIDKIAGVCSAVAARQVLGVVARDQGHLSALSAVKEVGAAGERWVDASNLEWMRVAGAHQYDGLG